MSQRWIAAFAVLMFSAGCATASDKSVSVLVPEGFEKTYQELQYAPAVRAGSMLYLSGVVANVADGETSMVPAIERAFDEIETILAHAGAQWSDVVDVTSYMTDLDNQLWPLWEVKGQRVPAPYPAWTAIGVDRLYGGDAAIIEIKVTAYLPDPPARQPRARKERVEDASTQTTENAATTESAKPEKKERKKKEKESDDRKKPERDSVYDIEYDRR